MIFLCIIVLLGAILRFYNFTDLLRFNNDQVRDAKIIENMITEHEFPLLGPKAGGTTFKLGPAFYYMEYLSARTFGNTPQGIALFIPILGTLSIVLFYILLKKYFADHIALSLTLLYATSFYVIKYNRFAWNPNLIPFFLFLFFLILLNTLDANKKYRLWWYGGLGIVTGVAMQLHTTFFMLLPVLIALTHGFNYVRTKTRFFSGIMITYGIIFFLLSPMFIYDMQNNGKNITAFLHGSETKSEKSSSLMENVLLDGQFFVQSTIYVLTGTEPTRNWTHPKKLLLSRDHMEISLAIGGSIFFLLALYFFITAHKTKNTTQQKNIHTMYLSMIVLCFILFLPIAHEINTRFFIILIFLPFIFLGVSLEKILLITKIPRIARASFIIMILCVMITANILTYRSAYDLTRTTTSSDIYGGISMQELEAITQYMSMQANSPTQELHMIPHTYGQSLRYIAHKNDVLLSSTAPNNIPTDALAFYLSDKIDDMTLPKKISPCFKIQDTKNIFRFRIFTLQKTVDDCK